MQKDEPLPLAQNADKEGLIAIGGELSSTRILEAYTKGIFPWYEAHYPILWWSPDPRLILEPNQFKLAKSLKKQLNKTYHFKIDHAFAEVIKACASLNDRLNKTWITKEMQDAYIRLHEEGYAHSFEVWDDSNLIGGLYGLSLGHAFFGESMFHTERDASKLAFYHLCQTLEAWDYEFIDCQLPTAHLESLGAKQISRKDFLIKLENSLKYPTKVGKWS
ncbi:MAG: leucyl/phenylalanyl-tRNA--protein transferase [Proteobacteria bacterium]|nr:leucyl/phenylalanyl-tRNA--protein transferase [Pseudomonadota bacterium]